VLRSLDILTSSNPVDVGWVAVRTAGPVWAGGNSWEGATGLAWEVTVNGYGVAVTTPQG
jgi:hypothetical protein